MTRWAGRVGRAGYYRGKGEVWMAPIRQWILPALGGSAALKYLGLRSSEAVAVMLGVAVLWELAAVALGWLEHRIGATEAHYRAALETDPFKVESLDLLREIRDFLLWEYERVRR